MFLVPGNHDHDRDIAKNLLEEAYKAQDDETDRLIDNLSCSTREELLRAFERFNTVYEKVFCVPYYTKLDKPHIIESSSGISIIKLNTAWLDVDSKEGGVLHFGHTELLDELEKSKDNIKSNLCIALGHHPIESFSDAEQKRLLDLFSRFNIHLYLCGHKHIPSITHIHDSDVIQLVCPGGFIDGYSHGGYIYGVLDTDTDFYKAECYSWKNGSWRIESSLDGTDESLAAGNLVPGQLDPGIFQKTFHCGLLPFFEYVIIKSNLQIGILVIGLTQQTRCRGGSYP